jgi:hypothetical protein
MILGRPAIRVEVQRQFWSLIRAGAVPGDAADEVGVSRTVAWRWFRQAGGVMPPDSRLLLAEQKDLPAVVRRARGDRLPDGCR